ncbi:MAG: uracil-DNA glycosylase [Clostridia bacterium]|nr:uracil-DNA glycosylase [Clostridia bacterium]
MDLNELKEKCEQCRACPLWETRKNLVFGAGNQNADILFVGEAPGETEDETGVPFVGRAGKLFDKYLEAVGIKRDDVYIANMLKCRPPKNRDPQPSEQDACIGFLREQTRLISPKMIVCLGRISAMRIISPDFKITRDHGIFYERKGVILTAVYHPSLLLRDPRRKDEMLADMLKIKAKADELSGGGN